MKTTLAERIKESLQGPPKRTGKALAAACGVKPPSVSDWINGHTKTLEGSNLIAAAEFLGVRAKWLADGIGAKYDDDHTTVREHPALYTINTTHQNNAVETKNKPDELEIPQFETGGSMGSGLLLRDQPGVIKSWTVNSEWVDKNVPNNTGAANLCIVTGFGPSMRPIFNSGDPLLVDRGVTSYEGDAIYFFRVGDEGYIKSLQSIPGDGLRVISANRENFDAWTIKPDMDFQVFGRVLKVWKSEEL